MDNSSDQAYQDESWRLADIERGRGIDVNGTFPGQLYDVPIRGESLLP